MFDDLSWVREGDIRWLILSQKRNVRWLILSQRRECSVTYPHSEKGIFGYLSWFREGNVRWLILSRRRECSVTYPQSKNVMFGDLSCEYPGLPETDQIFTYPESFIWSGVSIWFRFHRTCSVQVWLDCMLTFFIVKGKHVEPLKIKDRNLRHSYFKFA